MLTKKIVEQHLEVYSPSDKQVNAIYMMARNLDDQEFKTKISSCSNMQDVFDTLRQNSSSDDYNDNYIDLRNYPNIPANVVKQWDKENDGLWFKFERGEWLFVGKDSLQTFKPKWNEFGELVRRKNYVRKGG